MTNILFLCPHSAAKSVLAAAYCQQLAKERGLDPKVDFAGTHPDETIAPAVAAFLKSQHLEVTHAPRRVTRADVANATKLISIGCELEDLPLQGETVEQWDDVPPVSQGLQASWQHIQKKVDALLTELKSD
jgi:protein-tyrosine-phosphatase